MILDMEFEELNSEMDIDFEELQTSSDGGYERGYAKGYTDGLAARTHETWTITLVDGSIVEKDVALL